MTVIEVKNVHKSFKVYQDKGTTLKERVLFKKRNSHQEHHVLKGIDININQGEVVGLIGKNGCGKSTLLKLMTKIIYPNEGEINVKGKVSSLLELGAGFHPDMTGRENIYTNASIFGLTKKEIDDRLDSIISFSELEEFIDNPVRTYSSGMYMRLAFSVAINVEADILLIDEILAVGDSNFQRKCFEKIDNLKVTGKTIVIVSHDMTNLKRLCDTVYWIKEGEIHLYGEPEYIIDQYIEATYQHTYAVEVEEVQQIQEVIQEKDLEDISDIKSKGNTEETEINVQYLNEKDKKKCVSPARWGNREVEILSVKIINREQEEQNNFKYGEYLEVKMEYRINKSIKDLVFGFGIFLPNGDRCYGTNTEIDYKVIDVSEVGRIKDLSFCIENLYLTNGEYRINVAAHTKDGYTYDYLNRIHNFNVYSSKQDIGIFKPVHQWK